MNIDTAITAPFITSESHLKLNMSTIGDKIMITALLISAIAIDRLSESTFGLPWMIGAYVFGKITGLQDSLKEFIRFENLYSISEEKLLNLKNYMRNECKKSLIPISIGIIIIGLEKLRIINECSSCHLGIGIASAYLLGKSFGILKTLKEVYI